MPVVGIGGLFFRAKDPQGLHAWYQTHLGMVADDGFQWMQQAGPTVFMPFPEDTDHFPAARQWMLNLRVTDLDQLLASLRAASIETTTNPDWDTPETGKFARITDPEGNPVELWEPPAA